MSSTTASLVNVTTSLLVTGSHVIGEILENVTHAMDRHGNLDGWHHDDHVEVADDHHEEHVDDHHAVSYIPWNNPDNVITAAQRDLGLTVIDCGLVPPVVLFGLVGNIITLMVFIRQGIKEKTNICLFALAVSDTMFLITTYMEKVSCLVTRMDEVIGNNWAALLHPQGYFISLYFGRVTSLLTMVIGMERCVAVLRPFQAKTWLTATRMRSCVISVYVIIALLITPMFCVYTTRWEYDTSINRTRIHLQTTKMFEENHRAFECYGDIALSIALRQIPCYMVALSTIAVICAIRKHNSWRSETGSGKKDFSAQEQKLTKMLVAISCLYVLCLTPGNILMIVRHVITDIHVGRKNHNLAIVLTAANVFTEIINSSFNFVIYMLMSQKFLTTAKKMFGCEEAESKPIQPEESSSTKTTKVSTVSTSVSTKG
ncbi:proteinase-activated receptor 2-like [Haliotis rufescens]|uniref:proteinase-activated receptor 2-like n=1 Tax=Haliotis rufescens TaxID=6454 RepID=UPI001EB06C7F|nr:proteinase-activated receptor 2-like [Haliotis rufescens]